MISLCDRFLNRFLDYVPKKIVTLLGMTTCIGHFDQFMEALQTITGWDIDKDELQTIGERIDTMRQAFNIREGLTTPWKFPDRMMGIPPKKEGPRAGVTMNADDLFNEYYQERDWDIKTGKPSKAKLLELGLDDVAKVLYP